MTFVQLARDPSDPLAIALFWSVSVSAKTWPCFTLRMVSESLVPKGPAFLIPVLLSGTAATLPQATSWNPQCWDVVAVRLGASG